LIELVQDPKESLGRKLSNVQNFTRKQADLNKSVVEHVESVEERLASLEQMLTKKDYAQEALNKMKLEAVAEAEERA